MEGIDWYERRDELMAGQVFKLFNDLVVRLDRRVPGDATEWYADTWSGFNKCFLREDYTIEPGDLVDHLSDDWAGA